MASLLPGWHHPRISAPDQTNLLLSTGERILVQGAIEDVEKRLQNAVRSSPGTVAWLEDAGTGESMGVNPAHVVTLTRYRMSTTP